jgi:NAD(P)-dependent dehydrogenase (short-subunit alcohol dehydrogenase family)
MRAAKESQWALVGGGSGGIGRAISEALAEGGWNVAVTFKSNEEGARATVSRVEAAGGEARTLQVDLTDAATTAAAVSSTPPGRGSPSTTSPTSPPSSSATSWTPT